MYILYPHHLACSSYSQGLNTNFKEVASTVKARETQVSFEELHDKLTAMNYALSVILPA